MKLLKMIVGLLAMISMAIFIVSGEGLTGLLLLIFSSISLAILINEEFEIKN